MDEKLIFSKYSNDRANQYCIATDILELDGKKYVKKRAMNKNAISHIQNIYYNADKLKESFINSKFRVNHIIELGEDYVSFEYIKGKNYEEILDKYLDNEDWNGLKISIQIFFDEIYKCKTSKFQNSEFFKKCFGDLEISDEEIALSPMNIDLIFQNVIIDDEKNWNVIDYEWVADCMVPIRFLEYRSLYLYMYSHSKRKCLIENNFLNEYGFTEEEIDIYKKMEENFQSFVKNGHLQLGDFYQIIGKGVEDSKSLFIETEKKYVKVFFDTGKGFNENEIQLFHSFPLILPIYSNVKAIKIRPSINKSYIIINSILDKQQEVVKFEVLGRALTDNEFFIDGFDEGIVISNVQDYNDYININIFVENISDFLEKKIEMLKLNIDIKNNTLAKITNSLSWKITKPIRKLCDLFIKN